MNPKRKTKSYTYHGFTAYGMTVAEAKDSARQMLDKFIEDATKAPRMLEFANTSPFHNPLVVVIYRDMHSWCYRFSDSPCTHSGIETRDKAERWARLHAAQILCVIPENARMELILDKVDQAQHQSWFNWQCRYKAAHDAGYTTEDARTMADQGTMVIQEPECFCKQIGNGLVDACPLHNAQAEGITP